MGREGTKSGVLGPLRTSTASCPLNQSGLRRFKSAICKLNFSISDERSSAIAGSIFSPILNERRNVGPPVRNTLPLGKTHLYLSQCLPEEPAAKIPARRDEIPPAFTVTAESDNLINRVFVVFLAGAFLGWTCAKRRWRCSYAFNV